MTTISDIKSLVIALMGSNPYDGFDASAYALDVTGWQSHHPWFEAIIGQIRPRRILEVGTWKGASAIPMAGLARILRPGGVMFGDDYSDAEPGVIRAVNRFADDSALYLSTAQEKWALKKPG